MMNGDGRHHNTGSAEITVNSRVRKRDSAIYGGWKGDSGATGVITRLFNEI